MHRDDGLPETEAQWVEHTAGWRYAHLERAPSSHLRQAAIEEHERQEWALQAAQTTGDLNPAQVWARLPLLTRQAIVGTLVVAVLVIGAVLR